MWWHIGHELIVIVVMLSGCMVLVLGCEVAGLSLVEALNSGQPGVPVCLARLQNGANTYLLAIVNFAETLSNDSGGLISVDLGPLWP